ncbi:hypothetical protein M758_12G033200, partial [Ceratodon purpureus]
TELPSGALVSRSEFVVFHHEDCSRRNWSSSCPCMFVFQVHALEQRCVRSALQLYRSDWRCVSGYCRRRILCGSGVVMHLRVFLTYVQHERNFLLPKVIEGVAGAEKS